MPIKDNKSNTTIQLLWRTDQGSDGVVESPSVDTADYDDGITFFIFGDDIQSGASVNLTELQESADDGVSDPYATVPTSSLIGSIDDMNPIFVQTNGAIINSIGVIGVKRYVRLQLTFSNGTTTSEIRIFVNKVGEVIPGDS